MGYTLPLVTGCASANECRHGSEIMAIGEIPVLLATTLL